MLTFQSIKREKPELSDADILAFLRFCNCFECLDADSYDDAHNKILISMESISDEMECADNAEEQGEIMRRRYAKL